MVDDDSQCICLQVADLKTMMNPDLSKWFGQGCHVRQVHNVSQPLHFCFELTGNGRGCVRTKANARQEQWSEPFFPLKCEDNGLNSPDHPHKLKLANVRMTIKERKVSKK